jgi:hypothetical protein
LRFFRTAGLRPDGPVSWRKTKHCPEAAVGFFSPVVSFCGLLAVLKVSLLLCLA